MKLFTKISYKDVYQKPFRQMHECSHVFSSNNVMSFTFDINMTINQPDFCKYFIDILNGASADEKRKHYTYSVKGVDLFVEANGMMQLVGCVRGWGYLTGCGALGLSQEEAKRIQDEFIEYILKTLNQ